MANFPNVGFFGGFFFRFRLRRHSVQNSDRNPLWPFLLEGLFRCLSIFFLYVLVKLCNIRI